MKGLKVADANKFTLRSQRQVGEPLKGGQLAARPRKAASNKENDGPTTAKAGKPVVKQVEKCANNAVAACPNAVACASKSLMKKYSVVGDVDLQSGDYRDCMLVSGYVKDIFSYLHHLETASVSVRPDFLQSPARLEITPRMRSVLLDWLVQVHQRFTLLPETLYLTYHIVDSYMSSDAGPAVVKGQFQLVGVTAMLLASKYEEIYPPNVSDFVYVTDNAYTAADVLSMERRILAQLGYFLGYPLPIQFLRRYGKVTAATPAVHEAAKYLAELARADYTCAHLPPSALAAAALCLARELLVVQGGAAGWTDALEVFSGYGLDQLTPVMRLLAGIAVRAGESVKCTAIRKKYGSNAVSMVSTWPELSSASDQLRLAAGLAISPVDPGQAN